MIGSADMRFAFFSGSFDSFLHTRGLRFGFIKFNEKRRNGNSIRFGEFGTKQVVVAKLSCLSKGEVKELETAPFPAVDTLGKCH